MAARKSSVLIILTVFAGTAGLAGAEGRRRPIAQEQIGGTTLSLLPNGSYVTSTLRVSGPQGYRLEKRGAGEAIVADLLTESRPIVTAGQEKVAWAERGGLPDGRYYYEAELRGPGSPAATVTGMFFVEGQAAFSRAAMRERLSGVRGDLLADGSSGEAIPERAGNAYPDLIVITDAQQDGETLLELMSNDNPPDDPDWELYNTFGTLRIAEDGVDNRMVILPGGYVGIGTSSPATLLDLRAPGVGGGLESVEGGFNSRILRMSGGFPAYSFSFGVGPFGLNFYDYEDEVIARFLGGSTDVPLNVWSQGVVIGSTSLPQARLHVFGDGIIEGDVSLGSSRKIKHELEPVSPESILDALMELPLYRWKYIDDDHQATHLGPMAEDFHGRLGLGRDDKHLSPADSAGLALAAVQGLNGRLEKTVTELFEANRRLEGENEALLRRLERVEQALAVSGPPG